MESKHCDTIVDKAVCGFYEFLGTLILTAAIVLIANNGGELMGIPLAYSQVFRLVDTSLVDISTQQ